MFFPYLLEINFKEIRIVVDKGRFQAQSRTPFRLQIIFGHVRGRHWQTMQRALLKQMFLITTISKKVSHHDQSYTIKAVTSFLDRADGAEFLGTQFRGKNLVPLYF